MKHTNLQQRRMERGLTLHEMAAATRLPTWVLGAAEREARRDAWTACVRASIAAVLLRVWVVPTA